MMATHASQQSRAAMSSPRQLGGQRAGAPAGGGSGPKISFARTGGKGGSRHSDGGGSGSPLVRGSNGSVNLRGGSRSIWKRDMLGRFSS
jgi:hypothetical protein